MHKLTMATICCEHFMEPDLLPSIQRQNGKFLDPFNVEVCFPQGTYKPLRIHQSLLVPVKFPRQINVNDLSWVFGLCSSLNTSFSTHIIVIKVAWTHKIDSHVLRCFTLDLLAFKWQCWLRYSKIECWVFIMYWTG